MSPQLHAPNEKAATAATLRTASVDVRIVLLSLTRLFGASQEIIHRRKSAE